jgi:hypothetical protein
MQDGIRRILNLKSASALAERPPSIPLNDPKTGAKAAGLRFERLIYSALPSALHGQWFFFEDENGPGHCQPDLIYPFLPDFFAIIEVKYTLVPGAHQKLNNLYLPVVSAALKAPAAGVVIVKNLDPRYRRGKIYTDLRTAAFAAFDRGHPTLLQYAGQSLIRPPADYTYTTRLKGAAQGDIYQ